MNERLKELRKALGLKQGDFAASLSISQGHLSDIENGRKEVSERVISISALKFNANEDWLRTGEGNMFNPMSEDEELDLYIGRISGGEDKFKKNLLKALCKLSEDEWNVLKKIISMRTYRSHF